MHVRVIYFCLSHIFVELLRNIFAQNIEVVLALGNNREQLVVVFLAVLELKIKLTLEEKLYYCCCIKQNRFRYSAFGREANRTLKDLLVPDYSCIPDFVKKGIKI